MMLKHKKGQSTLEYVILVTAVIAVMIAFLTTSEGPFQKTLNTTLGDTTGVMSSASSKWKTATKGMMNVD